MPDKDAMKVFLDSFVPDNTQDLEQLEKIAHEEEVPIIRRQTQNAIRTFLEMTKPRTVLEIGTAIGFSSVFICTYSDARVTTIENYEKRIPLARQNIKKMGFDDRITLLEGDAQKILPTLEEPYDLVFMDAAKGQYIRFLPEVIRLTRAGGVILTDNVLQDGDLLKSHFTIARRNRTILKRMRDYLKAITDDPRLSTTILPIDDGLAVTVKKR